MIDKFRVTFYPDNKTIEVAKDTNILSAAISAGIYLNSSCGGDGVCGKCKVIVRKGQVITQPTGAVTLPEKQRHIYLACLTTIHSDLEVEIMPDSRADFEKTELKESDSRLKGVYSEPEEIGFSSSFLGEDIFAHSPLATKIYLELPKPDLNDRISDLERIYRQIRFKQPVPIMQSGLANIRQLGELLRDSEWKITVTLGQRNDTVEIVLIEPGNTSGRNFGVCFDIGTTTISGQLVDLNNKSVLGTKAAYNKQAAFGSDVITRIIYAQEEDGLEKLHNLVINTINEMIKELVEEHSVDLNDVTAVLCSGNTTMIHLLMSIDPAYIRKEPYVPTANFLPVLRAAEAGIKINPRGLLSTAPGVSSYIGGDITAGVLSCGLDTREELSLLIDIGTNGEIVLGNKDFLFSAAASAGPAFEGSGVYSGMRAAKGAIEKINIDPLDFKPVYSTIGEVSPKGICGSGYIDIISQMLAVGLIDKLGKFKIQECGRVREGENGKEYVVVYREEMNLSVDIIVTEADIENIKRAKAAIYSAAAVLVKRMGFEFSDIKKIFIAGGFGTYIDVDKAVSIGLLPDLEKDRFIFVGNSSLSGARQMLLSYQAARRTEEIARKMTYLELSVEPAYMDEYMAALFFPHTDLNRFPRVKS